MRMSSRVVLYLLVVCFVVIVGCGNQQPRYATITGFTKVNLPRDIYTQAIDPNDPMYSVMSQPPDSWNAQFGNSERSAFGYQIALARQQRGELRQMIVDVNNTTSKLEKMIIDVNDIPEKIKNDVADLKKMSLFLMKTIGRDMISSTYDRSNKIIDSTDK